MKTIQHVRAVFFYIKNTGEHFADPFANFKISFEKIERSYLTKEELEVLYNKKFGSERLERVRDVFLFCCFTNLEDKKQRKENHGNELIVRNERPLMALSV